MDKPHNFNVKVVMTSTSEGTENQNILLDVTEFAATGGELTLKQMTFSKMAIPKMVDAMLEAFDSMSQPWQEQGMKEAMEVFEAATSGKPKARAKK